MYEESAILFESAANKDPRSVYASDALRGLKQVSTFDLNDANRYLNFRQNLGLPDETDRVRDTLNFGSAKGVYINKDFKRAINKLVAYTSEFPNGIFLNYANYMMAESFYNLEKR